MSTVEFKKAVYKLDADGNGVITSEEFRNQFKLVQHKLNLKLTDDQIEEAIIAIDKDGDGMFNVKAVIDWMVSKGYLNKAEGLGFFFTLVTGLLVAGAGIGSGYGIGYGIKNRNR